MERNPLNQSGPSQNKHWVTRLLVGFTLSLVLGASSIAQNKGDNEQRGISSGQAANIARSATGGKVLSVSPAGKSFKVKVLKGNGVVTNIRVDKASGKVQR